MTALFYFIVWAGLIFLMMRFGCGAHVMGHEHRPGGVPGERAPKESGLLRWIPPVTDIDPVCGKTVQTASARPSVHDGSVYYFCSRDCRERFEAAPDLYLDNKSAPRPPMESSNG